MTLYQFLDALKWLVLSALLLSAKVNAAEPRKFLADNGQTMIVLYEDGRVEVYGTPSEQALSLAAQLKREAARRVGLTKT